MYINEYDREGECALRGKKAEDLFEEWLKSTGRVYRKAKLNEQYQHIDFIVETPEKEFTIDIKGPKKVSRDGDINQEILWVEFKSVKGEAGWLYGGNEFLGFYQPIDKSFYVVKTKDLAELCEQICSTETVDKSSDALYKRYTRKGRKDVISMIKFTDLQKIDCWRIEL